jgi:hypothetical protein
MEQLGRRFSETDLALRWPVCWEALISEARRRRKRRGNRAGGGEKPGPPQPPQPSPATGAPTDADQERAFADPRAVALRDRGETAIRSFLTFLAGAPLLLTFAELLRSLSDDWPRYFGNVADPMEKVLSLADPKPVFALQALTLLLRAIALIANRWRENEQLFDALDALYAVTFSLLGFFAGAGPSLALFQFNVTVLTGSITLAVVSFVVLVGIDFLELRMTPFLQSAPYRTVVAVLYIVFAAVTLLTNK